jgi:subtilisin family serine protease
MRGLKEITVSFAFTLATLAAMNKYFQFIKEKERPAPRGEPVALQGRSEDRPISLSWGIKDVNAPEAWKLQSGNKDVVVAVIDTGCDIHHPDLSDNIWRNPGETGLDENGMSRSFNGVDDDANGFIDDVYGWNFVNNSPDVMDEHGHGTHIAGIIGARGIGSSGVAPHVSLMILKYYAEGNSGQDNLYYTVSAIRYAVKMGAKIINYSGGGVIRSRAEEEAIKYASDHGVLVVAAAGNEGANSDFFHFYPADYDLPNILSVTAVNRQGELLQVANWGASTVDIAAPGKNIYSTLPNGLYGYMTGTSQATAFATGAAALILAQDEQLQPPQIIARVTGHGRSVASLHGKVKSGDILDASKSVLATTLANEQARSNFKVAR